MGVLWRAKDGFLLGRVLLRDPTGYVIIVDAAYILACIVD